MDIVIEDLVRIILFAGIVIWYIYSLISRSKKSKAEEKARLQNPSKSVNNVSVKSSSTYGASKPPSMEDMFGNIFGVEKEESFWDKAQEEQVQSKSTYYYEDEEQRRERAFEAPKPKKLKQDIQTNKSRLYNETKVSQSKKTQKSYIKAHRQSLSRQSLKFSDNIIVQGFIFSEVISKPKGVE